MPSAMLRRGSPLAASYARLAEVLAGLRVTEEPPRTGDGWLGAHRLAECGSTLDEFLAGVGTGILREYGTRARPHVVASLAFHRYVWPACLLFTVPWFLHRRVPRVGLADVSFHRTADWMTVRSAALVCLPDDPAAGWPGAVTVPDAAALRGALRGAIAEHVGPLLDAFRARTRRGPHALWGMVCDEITEGLWHVARLLGEEDRAVAELDALLPGGTPPYPGGAGFRALSRRHTRDRLTCCLFYTLRPENPCVTCPRTCDAQRIERTGAEAERQAK
ncbi:iron-sulfur protein [Streptomyces sp. RPT161]|uniref:iron-sulfur protein n=1 Tax=Streptomyces sp. RPT161 TaxID=3015993 RepID=UPI0022B881B6|nr:iron-sulfur protein [Streptomyces sp. RPT161]